MEISTQIYYNANISKTRSRPGRVEGAGSFFKIEQPDRIPAGWGSRAFAGQVQYSAVEAGTGYKGGIPRQLEELNREGVK